MSRSIRLFEIIQLLRRARVPLTAQRIADELEVTVRTVYRDMVSLQAMRVPIDGEAGVGYVLRAGYDLPTLMFTAEEIDAIVAGLALLGRTGDTALQAAAVKVRHKIHDVLPADGHSAFEDTPIFASRGRGLPLAVVEPGELRRWIHAEEKLCLHYRDAAGCETRRTVLPLAVFYYVEFIVLAAWCELRADFRHFRIDRLSDCHPTGDLFKYQGRVLRQQWRSSRTVWPACLPK